METSIVRPRINDFYNILLRQDDVEFAIPFINEDIPLYVDPFLLWKSPHMISALFSSPAAFLISASSQNTVLLLFAYGVLKRPFRFTR